MRMYKSFTELVQTPKIESKTDSPKKRKINFSIAYFLSEVYPFRYERLKKNHW